MLRKEVNDLLTQTDPGTPMGDLFRQYWLPALLASSPKTIARRFASSCWESPWWHSATAMEITAW